MKGLSYFRKKIQEFELISPVEKSDFYREYTKFILEKMKTVNIVDSENKPVEPTAFFANPERAIAKIKEDRNLTLPVITISIDDIDEDVDRRRTSSNIVENILIMFNPSLDFKTKNSTNTKAFIEQVTDTSVANVSDREDRIIRKMIVLTAEAYLPNPKYLITNTGEIEFLGTDVQIVGEGEDINVESSRPVHDSTTDENIQTKP